MDTNVIVVSGRVVRDPEYKLSKGGTDILKFSIANNVKKGNDASFFDVVCFGKYASVMTEYISKGTGIIVTGQMSQSRYENDSGEKRSSWTIIATSFTLLGNKNDSNKKTSNQPAKSNQEDQQEYDVNEDEIPF